MARYDELSQVPGTGYTGDIYSQQPGRPLSTFVTRVSAIFKLHQITTRTRTSLQYQYPKTIKVYSFKKTELVPTPKLYPNKKENKVCLTFLSVHPHEVKYPALCCGQPPVSPGGRKTTCMGSGESKESQREDLLTVRLYRRIFVNKNIDILIIFYICISR